MLTRRLKSAPSDFLYTLRKQALGGLAVAGCGFPTAAAGVVTVVQAPLAAAAPNARHGRDPSGEIK